MLSLQTYGLIPELLRAECLWYAMLLLLDTIRHVTQWTEAVINI